MQDAKCSIKGCTDDVVFQHVQFMASGRNHVVSYCFEHKRIHERKVSETQILADHPTIHSATRTAEDILADSAIQIINRLRDIDSPEAGEAYARIKKVVR